MELKGDVQPKIVEQPALDIREGEELINAILGEEYRKELFGDDRKLTELVRGDYVDPEGNYSMFFGTVSDGRTFVIETALQGDERPLSKMAIEYPGGSIRMYDRAANAMTTYLADASKPNPGKDFLASLRQHFRTQTSVLRQEYQSKAS